MPDQAIEPPDDWMLLPMHRAVRLKRVDLPEHLRQDLKLLPSVVASVIEYQGKRPTQDEVAAYLTFVDPPYGAHRG